MDVRSRTIRQLGQECFHVLVAGGGINGAVSAAALAARCEMVVTLEDFLRRGWKIALLVCREKLRAARGLIRACRILFRASAQRCNREYFETNDPHGTPCPGTRSNRETAAL